MRGYMVYNIDEMIKSTATRQALFSFPLVRVRVWQQERDVTYDAEQMIDGTVRVANELH